MEYRHPRLARRPRTLPARRSRRSADPHLPRRYGAAGPDPGRGRRGSDPGVLARGHGDPAERRHPDRRARRATVPSSDGSKSWRRRDREGNPRRPATASNLPIECNEVMLDRPNGACMENPSLTGRASSVVRFVYRTAAGRRMDCNRTVHDGVFVLTGHRPRPVTKAIAEEGRT